MRWHMGMTSVVVLCVAVMLTALTGCSGGRSSGQAINPASSSCQRSPCDVTGRWEGTFTSAVVGESGTINADLTQSGCDFTGRATGTNSPVFPANVQGTLDGNRITFGIARGGITVNFEGTLSSGCTRASGTYTASNGDNGTWRVTKQ